MTGAEVIAARESLNLTVKEFADALGVTVQAIYMYEGGKRPFPLMAEKLLGYLLKEGKIERACQEARAAGDQPARRGRPRKSAQGQTAPVPN